MIGRRDAGIPQQSVPVSDIVGPVGGWFVGEGALVTDGSGPWHLIREVNERAAGFGTVCGERILLRDAQTATGGLASCPACVAWDGDR